MCIYDFGEIHKTRTVLMFCFIKHDLDESIVSFMRNHKTQTWLYIKRKGVQTQAILALEVPLGGNNNNSLTQTLSMIQTARSGGRREQDVKSPWANHENTGRFSSSPANHTGWHTLGFAGGRLARKSYGQSQEYLRSAWAKSHQSAAKATK